MDLRQLEYAVAVADRGGFTRAAAALHVSQPSLSHGVRTLEAELGLELFARLGRSVRVTAAGEHVLDAARQVLVDVAGLRAVAAAVAGVEVGSLDLAVLPTLAVDPLAELIGRFRTAHPGVTVRVREPDDGELVDRLVASGRCELGFTDLGPSRRGLTRIELFRQPVLAVCPPGTEIDGDEVTPSGLAALALVATPPGTPTRRLLDRVLARADTTATIAVETSQREAILPLVLAGAGAALLPASIAATAAAQGAVVRPLRPALTRRIGILHRAGPLSPPAAAMVRLAVDRLGDRPGRRGRG